MTDHFCLGFLNYYTTEIKNCTHKSNFLLTWLYWFDFIDLTLFTWFYWLDFIDWTFSNFYDHLYRYENKPNY